MTIAQDLQKSAVGTVIQLFIVDLTKIGGPVFYLTPHTAANGSSNVSFGGQVYQPMPIMIENVEEGSDGAPPSPTLKISNITRFLQSYLTQYADCVGGYVTSFWTESKYLDSGASPSGTQKFGDTTFIIEQLKLQNKLQLEFRLVSLLEAPGFKIPRMQVLRTRYPGAGLYRKN